MERKRTPQAPYFTGRKAEGSYVYAGTVLEEGEITLKVRQMAGASRYEKIALLLRIKPEKVLEIIATKQAHIEKCRKRLKQEAKP